MAQRFPPPLGKSQPQKSMSLDIREQSLSDKKGSRSSRDDLKKSSFEKFSPVTVQLTDLPFRKEQAFQNCLKHKRHNGAADLTDSWLMALVRPQIS